MHTKEVLCRDPDPCLPPLSDSFEESKLKICANRSALESDFVRSRQMLRSQYQQQQKSNNNNNKTKIKTKLSASVVKQNQNTKGSNER